MAAVAESSESFPLTDDCSTKNEEESSDTPVRPGGESVKSSEVLKYGGNEKVDGETCERRKKTRRGKPKRKNPYTKDGIENRKVANRSKNRPRFAHRHADAPYNTNEFLMEDHSPFVNTIVEPPSVKPHIDKPRPPRVRDPSFTSVESDEDHFYSSPEDEEEYLTKEFSNTYRELHIETLQGMSKHELIQQVLQLEEKLDGLEKLFVSGDGRPPSNFKSEKEHEDQTMEYVEEENEGISLEKIKQFQLEIGRLRLENEKLQIENERLQRRNRSSSVSSVDSESDSSTSSPSSVSSLSDKEELIESNLMEDMEETKGKTTAIDETCKKDGLLNDGNI